jgi:hypothetical protein
VRIAIVAPGSRGDVQPYIALGKGLQDAGHDVRIVTNLEFEPLVRSYGLDCLSVAFGVQDAFQDQGTRAAMGSGKVLASFAKLADIARRSSRMLAECGLEACRDVDGILAGFGGPPHRVLACGEAEGAPHPGVQRAHDADARVLRRPHIPAAFPARGDRQSPVPSGHTPGCLAGSPFRRRRGATGDGARMSSPGLATGTTPSK